MSNSQIKNPPGINNRRRKSVVVCCLMTFIAADLFFVNSGFAQKRGKLTRAGRTDKVLKNRSIKNLIRKKRDGLSTKGTKKSNVRDASQMSRILFPTLKVRESMGDVAQSWLLKRTVYQPETFLFRWTNSFDDVAGAQWQISDRPLPKDDPDMNQAGVLKTGWLSPIPDKGKGYAFTVDFRSIMPAQSPSQPKTYYVRMVTLHAESKVRVDSQSVEITQRRDDNPITQFTPEGLGMTVKQKHAWMYKNVPMPVEIDLDELYVGNSNESNGDEPYLIPFILFADGTSIDPLNFANSKIRVQQVDKLHGNVPDEDKHGDDLDTAKTARIPNSTGRFTETIRPIGFGLVDDIEDATGAIGDAMKKYTSVYIVVIAMEEDNTSRNAIARARQAARKELMKRANGLVQSLNSVDLLAGNVPNFADEIKKFQGEIKSKAIEAATDATLVHGWWVPVYLPIFIAQAADPDDFVGFGYQEVTLADLLSSDKNGIPIDLDLSSSSDWEGSYTVKGKIRRTNFK